MLEWIYRNGRHVADVGGLIEIVVVGLDGADGLWVVQLSGRGAGCSLVAPDLDAAKALGAEQARSMLRRAAAVVGARDAARAA